MESLLPLVVSAVKLPTVTAVSWIVVIASLVVFVAAWLWLAYQNYRFSPIQGILSLIPIWALIYGFFRMEHAKKDTWLFLCIGSIAVAALGGILLYSAQVCDSSPSCMPSAIEQTEETDQAEPSSSLVAPDQSGDIISLGS